MSLATLTDKPTTLEFAAVVLEHLARYRLTTLDAVIRLPALTGIGKRKLRQSLHDCEEHQLVGAAALHRGLTYWHVAAHGARRLGLQDGQYGPLSEPAKIRAYALLRFCCLSEQPVQRLTRQEIASRLPELFRPGMPGTYYFDGAGRGRLGMARIDAGHSGRWDRILDTAQQDVLDHSRRPAWRKLIDAGRFELAVLTVFPQKAERLQAAIARRPVLQAVPVRIVALPELLPLVASIRRKEVTAP